MGRGGTRSVLAGLGGLHPERGLFGGVPAWVDLSKPAGASSNQSEVGLRQTACNVATLRFFFFSPNLVWFAIACAVYALFPYDLAAAARGWSLDWMLTRLALNFAVCFAYYAFFFVGLYRRGWAAREYRPGVRPTASNMAHNLYYWSLGVVQWTCWEGLMMRLWATGAVPYADWGQIASLPSLFALNAVALLLVPIWRDVHFYIAHRFIHVRALYRYVHSLHHRNADPEPFSGLTMHPVEHVYYFSNALIPSLYVAGLSPLVFLWCYIHLVLAPACGHSGWEDHFAADQYHYLHHQKFECNYGSPSSGFLDLARGTFREKMGASDAYKGEYTEPPAPRARSREKEAGPSSVWAKDSHLGVPSDWTHGVYTAYWVGLWPLLYWALVANQGAGRVEAVAGVRVETLVASALVYGPLALALGLCRLTGDRLSWRWPFHKEAVWGAFGAYAVLGQVAVLMPVFHATKWACAAQP